MASVVHLGHLALVHAAAAIFGIDVIAMIVAGRHYLVCPAYMLPWSPL